ncbi:MAG TPA: HAD family hydrolase, partial [Pirellulales bacterium]|nr:HAD family hydrolase [Pirellulales bacterium]
GVIFDLDGTLVDSGLDFEQMRREMGLPPGTPLLEAIASLDEAGRSRCTAILESHEQSGAERASLMPGVVGLLRSLSQRQVRQAVLTRNARKAALATLARLGLTIDLVFARDDAPAKPNPAAIWRICDLWELARHEVAIVGDYVFDIEAGRRAGVRTVLYTAGRDPAGLPGGDQADLCLRSISEPEALVAWLAEPG